ncbi:MAG: hypothetical protein QXE01_04940 [Sulfolobales archaeon]
MSIKYPLSIRNLAKACIKEAIEPGMGGVELCPSSDLGAMQTAVCKDLVEAVARVSATLIYRKEFSIYCRLCGDGPYTKKGVYLHLLRKHLTDIEKILGEELERISSRDF